MTNEMFMMLSDKKKRAKFGAILKDKSKGTLTYQEIQKIVRNISLQQQFQIFVYHSIQRFCEGVHRVEGAVRKMIVGSEYLRNRYGEKYLIVGHVVAVTIQEQLKHINQLHIYIPKRYQEAL